MDCEFCGGKGHYVWLGKQERCEVCGGGGKQGVCGHCGNVHYEECHDA